MKNIKFKKVAGALALATVLTVSGCSTSAPNSGSGTSGGGSTDKSQLLTLDYFSGPGNYMGKQEGWYGDLIKEKFNIELNIIAPNVAGGGETLYQTRSAAGNLGDIVVISKEQTKDCVQAGLISDISAYIPDSKYLKNFQLAIDGLKEYLETDKVYGIPTNCSTESASTPYFYGVDPEDATYVRFDLFSEIGAPDLETYEDLLDALKQMQEKFPTSESGAKTYGFSFFKDWDGGYMKMANCLVNQLGYNMDNTGFYLKNGDGTKSMPVTDKSGAYYRALEILFTANQMGLVDPDSSSQTWDDYTVKVKDGAVLYAPWPWASITHYNTHELEEKGIGYAFVPVEECKYWTNGQNPYGTDNNVLCIGSKCKDIDRVMEFVDWFASPENSNCYTGCMGPQGILWDMVDGRPTPTEEGQKYLQQLSDYTAPEELGGGNFVKGYMQTCSIIQHTGSKNPETGEPYNFDFWSSVIEGNRSKLDENWTERYGSQNAKEYLLNKEQVEVSPGCMLNMPKEPSDIATTRASCSETLINSSWKMVFASDRAEFDKIWDDMTNEMIGLGYEKCLEWDKQNLEIYKNAKLEALKNK